MIGNSNSDIYYLDDSAAWIVRCINLTFTIRCWRHLSWRKLYFTTNPLCPFLGGCKDMRHTWLDAFYLFSPIYQIYYFKFSSRIVDCYFLYHLARSATFAKLGVSSLSSSVFVTKTFWVIYYRCESFVSFFPLFVSVLLCYFWSNIVLMTRYICIL